MCTIRSASTWTRAYMRWTPRPSTCAYFYFRGRSFAITKQPSRCPACWTCTAISPCLSAFTDGKVHDVNILDEIMPEAGAFYVMDRGYIDFERLFVFTLCSAFFVVRSKENVLLQRRYSHPVDKTTGVRSDHTVILTSFESALVYPDVFRRVTYLDVETKKWFKFLNNLWKKDTYSLGAKVTVVNLLNKVALYNFLSSFSGTHFVAPRTLQAEIVFQF